MSLLRNIILLIMLCVSLLPVRGSEDISITINRLPLIDLMQSRCVISIYQDSEGEMWYGTEDGLCRDNGHSIKVYYPSAVPEVISENNQVLCITEDSIGNIWFGSSKGAYRLNKRSQQVTPVTGKRIENQRINTLFTSSDGSVWLGVDGTLFRFNSDGQLIKDYPTAWNNIPTHTNALYEDSRGNLWMTLWNGGICRLDRDSDNWIFYPWPYDEHAIGITEDISGRFFWVATWMKGIVKFDPFCNDQDSMYELMLSPSLVDERDGAMLYLTQDRNYGLLWATTNNGLKVFKHENGRLSPISNISPEINQYQMLTQLMRDRNGNIWVGGYNVPSFIVSFNHNDIITHRMTSISKNSGHTATISEVCHDDEPGLLWVFQERHRLYLYDLETGQMESEISSLFSDTHNNAGSLYMMHKSRRRRGVWVGCHLPSGIYLLEQNNRKISVTDHIDFVGKIPPTSMFEDSKGTLWIGTDSSLFAYDTETRNLATIKTGIGSVSDILEDTDGCIVVASRRPSGFSTISLFDDGKQVSAWDFPAECTALAITPDSTTWIGTRTGEIYMCPYDGETVALSECSDYIASGYIAGLLLDKNNHLWAQTEQRLTEINPATLDLRNYYTGDPQIGLFNLFPRSYTLLPSGHIMFGGTGGVCEITPTHDLSDWHKTNRTYITAIKVDSEPVEIPVDGKRLDISPSSRNLEIEFSCNDHLNASRISYAYRISDNDGNWIKLAPGVNTVNINRLNKGDHLFEVKCITGDHVHNAGMASLIIDRLPAFYETWWFYSLLIIACIGIILAIDIAYNRHKLSQQHKKMEEELAQLKINFFTNITHELRTPLTLILTPLESLIHKTEDSPLRRQLLNIRNSANELMTLINQILNFRKLEVGGERLTLTKGDVVEFLQGMINNFKPLAAERNIDLSFEHTCDTCYMTFDIAKLRVIINNLLSNAFKFTSPNNSIHVNLSQRDIDGRGYAIIKVTDTGQGIPADNLAHIFDPFYNGTNESSEMPSSGIGLHVTGQYIKMLGGTVNVISEVGNGTEFVVKLPVDIDTSVSDATEFTTVVSDSFYMPAEEPDTTRKTVLLIEDNDEFRDFMKSELSEIYNVIDEPDAFAGEKSASENHPDIIISDVMMPRRDGFQFCNIIKSNIATSDIPVILLTARNDSNAELTAYRNRADAFVQKPFNMQVLFKRIENLIDLRKKRQMEFREQPEADVSKIAANPLDEVLLEKIMKCVDDNITNSDYGIAELSRDVNMSRMNLYRKLQNITGQTPTDFVKTIRLKKAARMLVESNCNIVEIAYAVGYSSPSYFTRSFKNEFGMTPKQFQEKNKG